MPLQIYPPQLIHEQGHRSRQEDSVFPRPMKAKATDCLFMVCDGMGGPPNGKTASQLCSSTCAELLKNQKQKLSPVQVNHALKEVHQKLCEHVEQYPEDKGLGTTITLLQISDEGILLAWCGDSRIYHLRDEQILYQTKDHSLVQEMIDQGKMEETQAYHHSLSHIIRRAVSSSQLAQADFHFIPQQEIRKNDHFLLCSDGVLEVYGDPVVLRALFDQYQTPGEIAAHMCDTCRQQCDDNSSAYLLTIQEVEP